MKKINIQDVYRDRIEMIDVQLRVAKKRGDKVSIAKLTSEKKKLEGIIKENQQGL